MIENADQMKTDQAATDETRMKHGSAQLLHEDVTRAIIVAAFDVHRVLGDGFLPRVEPNDLCRIRV